MKWARTIFDINKPWALPVIVLTEFAAIFGIILLFFHLMPKPWLDLTRAPEQPSITRSYILPGREGEAPIQVTEQRSGTEFNRILQFPNGRIVVESGWVNRWGEDQIRIIGNNRDNDP
jgi:hypothetical protein